MGAAMKSRRFEYEDPARAEIWEIGLADRRIEERSGKRRRDLRSTVVELKTEDAARVEYARRIAEKLARGFVEMTAADERALWGHLSFAGLLDADDVGGIDPNLKLALECELARRGRRNHIERLRGLHARYDDRYTESDDDEDDADSDVEAMRDRALYREVKQMLNLPISAEELAQIDAIAWDHSAELVYAIYPRWNGEDDFFDIRCLRGLERCPSLRRLELLWQSCIDISPLTALQQLEQLSFEYPRFERCDALLSLPSLRRFRASGWSADAERVRPTLDQLRANGVSVEVDFY